MTDDAFWRRPSEPDAPAKAPIEPWPEPPYPGPPPSTPPPAGWRPPVVVQPPPPRRLPVQDTGRLDRDEAGARTITYGVGMLAGAVMLVIVCLLCSRVVF